MYEKEKHSEIKQYILRPGKYLYFNHIRMHVALLERKHDFTLKDSAKVLLFTLGQWLDICSALNTVQKV